jgi:3-oxoacyl-[acyl-carrier-protein] synthase-3
MSLSLPLSVRIAGLGHYLPERRVLNAEIEEQLGLKPGWIARATGVLERRRASGDDTNSRMAAKAAQRALAAAGMQIEDIDLIVGASASPEQMIPCTAALVQRELGAPAGRSACFDINATCLSFAVALQLIAPLIASGVYKTVLLFSSEVIAESLNPNEPESASLMGDAAAAAILTMASDAEPGRIHLSRFATFSDSAHLTQILGGGTRCHPNNPRNKPETNQFSMQGPSVFRAASRVLPKFVDDFFETVGWSSAMVDLVVPHQASGHAITHLASRLGFSEAQVFVNLPRRGNCVAASLPLAMSEAAEEGKLRRGDHVLLLGTGAGLTLGAVAMTY